MPNNTKPRAVFYHVAHMGSWKTVDAEIMAALRNSGLLEAAQFVRNDCENVELYEFPTLDLLQAFAAENRDAHVLYLHTKGVTQEMPCIDDWRACMLYWMVERWRECVAKLNQGYDAVGINVVDTPLRHFQGNFWWSTTAHIRAMGSPRAINFTKTVDNMSERHKAEFWIISRQQAKVYQPYHHRIRPYSQRNPRTNYAGKAF